MKKCEEYGDSPAHFIVDEEGPKVVICENRVENKPSELKKYVTHELIHAYDFCRVDLNIKLSNLKFFVKLKFFRQNFQWII